MRQNIKIPTYCSSQTSHTTTNFYFFHLKMRTNSFTTVIIVKAPAQHLHITVRSRKNFRDTEHKSRD